MPDTFAKLTPVDMGEYRNKWLAEGKDLSELFTAAHTNGAGTPAYGAYFEMTARDDKYLILAYNSDADDALNSHTAAAQDITIKAGNDGALATGNDLVLADLAAGDFNMIKIDSGKFKNVKNNAELATLANVTTVKDCVVIVAESAYVKLCVIKMPF